MDSSFFRIKINEQRIKTVTSSDFSQQSGKKLYREVFKKNKERRIKNI